MEYFVVYAVDNAFLIIFRGFLVGGEVKEAMEALGWALRVETFLRGSVILC